MSNWTEIVEEGQVFWVNNELGNVVKVDDKAYVAMLPKIIRLGPFETLEQAQKALEINKASLENVLASFNYDLVNLSKALKQ